MAESESEILKPALRIPIQLPVSLGAKGSKNMALNLSTSGMFLKTHEYHKPGSQLDLEFHLTHNNPIRVRARVVWASEGVSGNECSFAQGLGLQFIKLPPIALQQIQRLTQQVRHLP
jgi:hypothetical protein